MAPLLLHALEMVLAHLCVSEAHLRQAAVLAHPELQRRPAGTCRRHPEEARQAGTGQIRRAGRQALAKEPQWAMALRAQGHQASPESLIVPYVSAQQLVPQAWPSLVASLVPRSGHKRPASNLLASPYSQCGDETVFNAMQLDRKSVV